MLSYRGVEAGDGEWPLAEGDWIHDRLAEDAYRTFLKRVHAGPVAVGEEWAEFVTRGCDSPQDVIIRVEEVAGGDALGTETELEIVPRRDVLATP